MRSRFCLTHHIIWKLFIHRHVPWMNWLVDIVTYYFECVNQVQTFLPWTRVLILKLLIHKCQWAYRPRGRIKSMVRSRIRSMVVIASYRCPIGRHHYITSWYWWQLLMWKVMSTTSASGWTWVSESSTIRVSAKGILLDASASQIYLGHKNQ